MDYNLLISNIDIVNGINVNEKLCLFNNNLYIDKPTCYRPFYRYCNNQNREKIYAFLIKLVDDISVELTKYKYYNCNVAYFKLEDLNIQSMKDYAIIFKKMDDMRHAFDKLKVTYKSNKEFVKKLDLLKNKVIELNPDYRRLKNY